MGLKCGIVGLPNVGKSTLFNALTKASIETANFPFCTIKPNIGIVPIPDLRLNQLEKIVKPQRVLSTTMEFVDIAGLVEGASKGKGLGNQFLSKIRETEAICHVVCCFEEKHIIHVAGKVAPVEDINIINMELALSDLDICKAAIYRVSRRAKGGDKSAHAELAVLEKCLPQLENSAMLRSLCLNKEEKELINYLGFLTLKPTMYIANINENNFENNPYLDQIYAFANKEGSLVVPVCAVLEATIAKLDDEEHYKEFITELGLKEPGLNSVIRAGYNLLNLQTYFTVGVKEVRAWTIPVGSTAAQAASKIHSDFKKGFIRAQTIAFEDFITYNGEHGAKEAGKVRAEGKDYIVQDGDIINFLFNI